MFYSAYVCASQIMFSHFELSSAEKVLKDVDTMEVDTLPQEWYEH